jgi:hypothetical protein
MNERDLLADCLRRLNGLGFPYMLTGSMASNFWGVPRTTHDLDFVLVYEAANAPAIVAAFQEGFSLDEVAVRTGLREPYMFNAIDRRSALKVDFWALRAEPFDQEMFGRRRPVELFGEPAWIATAEDTILHKLHWNRLTPSERQVLDAAGIVAVQEHLDRDYLTRWARSLGVEGVLLDLLSGRIRPKNS